jgi:hypothetical protein
MTRQRNVRRLQCERYLRHFPVHEITLERCSSRAAIWRAAGRYPKREEARFRSLVGSQRNPRHWVRRQWYRQGLTEADKAAIARAIEKGLIDP